VRTLPVRLLAIYLEHAPRWIARFAALTGLLVLADGLWHHHWRMLSAFSPPLIHGAPEHAAADAVVAVAGLMLLRIAAGLRKRKRIAWWLALAACAAITVGELVREERRPVDVALSITLLSALVLARSRFTAVADPRSRWFAARVAAQFLVIALGYGLLMLYLPGRVPGHVSFWPRLREVVLSLAGLGGEIPIRDDRFADAFHAILLGFGLLSAICTVVLLLRSYEPAAALAEPDERRLRALLLHHGERDSLGYFALRRDKSVIWSPTGKAAIAYRVVLGVALASGDPIGDPEAWPGAIHAYRDLVDRFGWTPAVMGCSELGATVFKREYGLAALALGDEAVLHPSAFTLDGRAMRGVRQACTRVARAGYTVQVRRVGALCRTEVEALRVAAAAWRGDTVERGFSMALSRIGDPDDVNCLVVMAERDGVLRGMLHFVPWSDDGISLDLMRRDRTSDNGLNEFMIAGLMQACPELGIERVSLNFAVFREALERGAQIGAGPVLRLWRQLLLLASRWWQIDSLYRFNAKFQPQWQPRFFSYPTARDIPRVALAALEAEAFIVRPRLVKRLAGRG
jgi:lysyl-tRNA synthetase class 2